MFPEIPADLSALSDADLADLYTQVQAYFNENRAAGLTDDEVLNNLRACAAASEAIESEQGARAAAAAERQAELDELAARMEAPPGDDPPEGEGDTTPPAEGDTTPPAEGDTPPEGEGDTTPQAVAAAGTGTRPRTQASRPPTPPLRQMQQQQAAPPAAPPANAPIRPTPTIVAGADIPHVPMGSELAGVEQLASALIERRMAMRGGTGAGDGESVIVASIMANLPEDRFLRTGRDADNRRLIEAVIGNQAITAAGGQCVPVQPYYDIMVLAGAQRPVRDATPGFQAERGGINVVPPPQPTVVGSQARTVNDGATTNGSNVVTSVAANFNNADVGAAITGAGIPANTIIVQVNPGANQAVLSANATATAAGVALTITREGAIGFITMAEDAAALEGTPAQVAAATKPCLHVTCPAPVQTLINAITRCLEFGNFTARAYPEQVQAWIELALSAWARRGETALLDAYSANSTQVTAAKVLGVARDLIAQGVKAAAYYRNRNRMDPDAPLRCMMPAWVLAAAVADLVRGSGYDAEYIRMARQLFIDGLAEANVNVTFYIDSGTGKGQLINAGNKQGAGALTTFPTTAVWYLFAEGSFLYLDGGSLDLGLVRDSNLNAQNNYRIFAETFEALAFVGVESLEITSTIVADGTFAGPAYMDDIAAPASF